MTTIVRAHSEPAHGRRDMDLHAAVGRRQPHHAPPFPARRTVGPAAATPISS